MAEFIAAGRDLINKIHRTSVKAPEKQNLAGLCGIAVDKFTVRKGRRYVSVVLGLETGKILHANHGKAGTLTPFLRPLSAAKRIMPGPPMDTFIPNIQAVRKLFPEVDLAHNPDNLVLLPRDIDETGKKTYRYLSGE